MAALGMEASVPFETYLSPLGVNFETEFYTELAVISYVPPWDWNMSPEEYRDMRSLDTDFYGVDNDNRAVLPIIVPREMLGERMKTLDMFTMESCEQLHSHPLVSTVPSQIRCEETEPVASY